MRAETKPSKAALEDEEALRLSDRRGELLCKQVAPRNLRLDNGVSRVRRKDKGMPNGKG